MSNRSDSNRADARGGGRLLCVFGGESPDDRPVFARELEAQGWIVDRAIIRGSTAARILAVLRLRAVGSYDVVATNEYFLTWALSVRLVAAWRRPKLVALSFNQSSAKLVKTGFRRVDRLLNRVWRSVNIFLVHSTAEARLFAELHDIPENRFVFSHWGFDLPNFASANVKVPDQPYVTMVGRNNRDLATFCAAVDRAGVKGVLITASYMLGRHPIEDSRNVLVLADRPLEECLAYVAGSFAHLVLVVDATRGAGHISAVSAMLLGKPQIFSDVAPLSDYLFDDFNGIAVPVGDVGAVAAGICRLNDDPDLAKRLGSAGRSFALEHMSHAGSARRMANILAAAAT
jgi:glycosyltransferase involved in cell wall biosynthesis